MVQRTSNQLNFLKIAILIRTHNNLPILKWFLPLYNNLTTLTVKIVSRNPTLLAIFPPIKLIYFIILLNRILYNPLTLLILLLLLSIHLTPTLNFLYFTTLTRTLYHLFAKLPKTVYQLTTLTKYIIHLLTNKHIL